MEVCWRSTSLSQPPAYFDIADRVAKSWATKVRNYSLRDDFYQVACIEIWVQLSEWGSDLPKDAEQVLAKRLGRACSDFHYRTKDRLAAFSIEAFRERYEWEDYEPEEEAPPSPEEVRAWATSGSIVHKKVAELLKRFPIKYRCVLEHRILKERSVKETALALGFSESTISRLEKQALTAMAADLAPEGKRPDDNDDPRYKWCQICEVEKPFDAFAKKSTNTTGRDTTCKKCRETVAARQRGEKAAAKKERLLARFPPGTTKPCELCQEGKPLTDYRPDGRYRKGMFAGWDVLCEPCRAKHPQITLRETSKKIRKNRERRESLSRDGKRACRNGYTCAAFRIEGKACELSVKYEEELCPLCLAREAA